MTRPGTPGPVVDAARRRRLIAQHGYRGAARALGLSHTAIVLWAKRNGVPSPRPRGAPPIDDGFGADCLTLWEAGYEWQDIADALGGDSAEEACRAAYRHRRCLNAGRIP